ncbi:MAG: hypothetical protein LBQ69_05615 [Treponema sp.]|jgi:hypothetical protein|nr:hypothetical protein [Treponema sp.]
MKRTERKSDSRFRLVDLFIVIFCLSVTAYSINLFRLDLFQTIYQQNEKPVGTIIIKNNIVQRRAADHVLWDRLRVESPVYLGDLIRTAELSGATLKIEGWQIDINENTLIRVQLSLDGNDALKIELAEGSVGIAAGEGSGGLRLSSKGRVVETGAGTVLSAAAGKDGLAVQVNEGAAVFIEEGRSREVPSGTIIAFNAEGTQRQEPSAVLTRPRPNARYVKNTLRPFPVGFAWNRINLRQEDTLRLEIAEDRNFNRVVQFLENLDASAEVSLEAGVWNWRLSFGDTIFSTGRLAVVEASNLELLSPARGSLFRYQDERPSLRFQWREIEEVSHYIFEVSETADFDNPKINRQIAASFFVDSSLPEGTWYWRVQPIFPPGYEGGAAFSRVSFFLIEQAAAEKGQAIALLEGEQLKELEQLQLVKNELSPETETTLIAPRPDWPPVSVELRLMSPARGARLPGLAALRTQTVFAWEADGEVQSSRFVLSRNKDPLEGRPAVEIINPGRAIRLNRLEEGVWYWTVEARDVNGLVSAAEPRQLQVLSIPLLPVSGNLQPSDGYRIGIEQLKTQRNIVFGWSTVPGANAYVFALYEQAANGRRQINRATVENTGWALENVSALGRGTFVWQVEAVNRNPGGTIEQRGLVAEHTFTIDIPFPHPVQMEDPGILYGL